MNAATVRQVDGRGSVLTGHEVAADVGLRSCKQVQQPASTRDWIKATFRRIQVLIKNSNLFKTFLRFSAKRLVVK